jgi:hypothetical protein
MLNRAEYSEMGRSWPWQNIQPVGAKFPEKSMI